MNKSIAAVVAASTLPFVASVPAAAASTHSNSTSGNPTPVPCEALTAQAMPNTAVTSASIVPVVQSRAICMFPEVATYDGHGDVNAASSFSSRRPATT
jgi:hypothetical protein